MPTVLRSGGFRVLILFPPREHSPAHVHVVKGHGLAVIHLATKAEAQRTVRVVGMSGSDRRAAERLVRDHTEDLMRAWSRIHG